jgi:hypothetical protein
VDEHRERVGEVEVRLAGESIGRDELEPAHAGRLAVAARLVEHRGRDVHADHPIRLPGSGDQQPADAAPVLKHSPGAEVRTGERPCIRQDVVELLVA